MGLIAAHVLAFALGTSGIDAKIASVLPTREEDAWLSIPWRMHLTGARKEAYEKKKPLFIWMMNGHPMGCT